MNPYTFVNEATKNGESLLSLCAGIGFELRNLSTTDITAVDIVPEYIQTLKVNYPDICTVVSDAYQYTTQQANDSVDVISIIDGIEHFSKKEGLRLIKDMKRVARKEILLFTPQGESHDHLVRNEPHHAWGIEAGDEYQVHKSGWSQKELEGLGFELLESVSSISQHNEPYIALMMRWRKNV